MFSPYAAPRPNNSRDKNKPVDLDTIDILPSPEDLFNDQYEKRTLSGTPSGIFLLAPDNARILQGDRSRFMTSNSGVLLFFTIVAIIGAVFFGFGYISTERRLTYLHTQGVVAEGTLINAYTNTGSKGARSYYLTIRFLVNGRAINANYRVSSPSYGAGRSYYVRYNPTNIYDNVLERNAYDTQNLGATVMAAVILTVSGGLLLVWCAIVLQRERRLMRNGVLLPGVLTSATTSVYKGSLTLHANYQFTTPNGRLIRRKSSRVRNDLKGTGSRRHRVRLGVAPQHGAEVVVLYHDDGLFRLL